MILLRPSPTINLQETPRTDSPPANERQRISSSAIRVPHSAIEFYARRDPDRHLLRSDPGRIPWLPGDLARAFTPAYSTDVGNQRDLRYLVGWLPGYCWCASHHRKRGTWFFGRDLFHDQRGRWFCDHRSHVEDVPKTGNSGRKEGGLSRGRTQRIY